jgi:hypothetical protein
MSQHITPPTVLDEDGVPDDVQDAIDRVVEAWTQDRSDLPSLRIVTAYLEELGGGAANGEGDVLSTFISPYTAIGILDALDLGEVASCYGLDDDQRPSHAQVNEYLEGEVERAIDDADVSYAFAAFEIEASNGDCVTLIASVNGYSFSELTTFWYGPYHDADEFLALLRKAHWLEAGDSPRSIPSRVRQRVRAREHDVRVHALKLPSST